MYLGGCAHGNVLALRDDVDNSTARAIEALVADEEPLATATSLPVHCDEYLALLGAGESTLGLTFVVADELSLAHDVPIVRSGTQEGDALLERIDAHGMPPALREMGYTELWAPWCIAMHDGEIAAVVETVRTGDRGVEAGVATIEQFRRRGLATAATAGWAAHPDLRDCTRFYSTNRTNVASQGVAGRLGLRFVGANFRGD
jgi:hypothetical protein